MSAARFPPGSVRKPQPGSDMAAAAQMNDRKNRKTKEKWPRPGKGAGIAFTRREDQKPMKSVWSFEVR